MKVRENLSRPLLYINPPFSSIPPFYRNIQKHPLSSQFWDTQTPLSKGGSGLWNSLPPHQRQPEKGYVAQISPETSTKASQINKSHRKTPPPCPTKILFPPFDRSAPFPKMNTKHGHIYLKPDTVPHALYSPIPVPRHEKRGLKLFWTDDMLRHSSCMVCSNGLGKEKRWIAQNYSWLSASELTIPKRDPPHWTSIPLN